MDSAHASQQKRKPSVLKIDENLPLSKFIKSDPITISVPILGTVPTITPTPPQAQRLLDENVPLSRLLDASKKVKPEPKTSTPKKRTVTEPKTPPKKAPKKASKKVKQEPEDEDDEDEEEEAPKKKRAKKIKSESVDASPSPTPKKVRRKPGEGSEEPRYEWWKSTEELPEGVKWSTLEHHGVLFPPPYQAHNIKLLYDGKPIDLADEEEEAATFYAQYLHTDHVKKKVFNTNFFNNFLAILNKNGGKKHMIKDFTKCDFSLIHQYLMEQKELKKVRSKEKKEQEKVEKEKTQEVYGWAIMDGYKQKIANYRVEPPGLFLGRGDHPKAGMIKKRVMPEDVTINIGKESKIPEPPIPGSSWKEVCHNNTVTWLAFWKENINDQFKYVWLSPSSRIKGQSDMKKFETARKLSKVIGDIRKRYMKELSSDDALEKQRATALWFIDNLALRVGNEKGEDEADTVGCCSLRVEHLSLQEPDELTLDFLGKDSMRYQRTIKVDPLVFRNITQFIKGKKSEEDLFDRLTTAALNAHLKEQMPGLTAKVFRTFNASFTLQRELDMMQQGLDMVEEKVLYYNRCNRMVAILCNHQRSLPKTFNEQMERLDEKIGELQWHQGVLKQQIKDLKSHSSNVKEQLLIPVQYRTKKKKTGTGTPTKKGEETADKGKGKKKVTKKKKKGGKEEEEDEDDDEDDDDDKMTGSDDEEEKYLKLPTELDKAEKQLEKLNERLRKWEIKKTEKDDLKTVALGTSKINYLDPRITAAWCKANDVPIERIFSKTLRDKFPWALDVDADWKF